MTMTVFLPLKHRLHAALMTSALTLAPAFAQATEAQVQVQLNDYDGDRAYFSLYLVNAEGRYHSTLWVSGDDEKWYPDLAAWWKYLSRAPQELDAITGASTGAGERANLTVEIAPELIDAGYRLRVESAVEDALNPTVDAEIDLSAAKAGEKAAGTGYVRFIRYKF
jgi:hypothetical protein